MEKYICDEQTIWLRDEDEAWSKVIELNCNLGRVIITDMLFWSVYSDYIRRPYSC